MKKMIGIGLVTAALLAGCGGAPSETTSSGTDAGSAASTTAVTGVENATGIPTSETGMGEAADTAPDATAATNATAVTASGAAAPDATAPATPEAATTGGDTAGTTSGDTAGAYQPAGIPELGISFQVPQGWEQVSGENAWSPAGVDVPRIGVESADLTADWRPSSFLPEGATIKSSQQVSLAGMQTMFYTIENSDGTAETHAIMRSGEKAYDFYARAASLQELQTIQPVLNDIVGSVQLSGV